MSAIKKNIIKPYAYLAIVICFLGILIRLKGLGKWPLAVDEYYFISSIENIIRSGLPKFECGGYYIRGIFQQYLSVPLRLYLHDPEYAIRVIPLLANVAAFPAIFLICRKMGGPIAAVIGVFFMAFSLWEIEFARFGRMDAFFQTIIIWQIWLLLQADKPKVLTNTWLSYLLAFLSVFIYAGAIFSFGLALLNPILNKKPIKIYDLIAWAIIAGLIAITHIIHFRRLGVDQYLPPEYLAINSEAGMSLPVLSPDTVLAFSEKSVVITIIAILLGIWGVVLLARSIRRNKAIGVITIIGTLIAIVGVVTNQLLLFLGSLAVIYLLDNKAAISWFGVNRRGFVAYFLSVTLWFIGIAIYIFFTSHDLGLRNILKVIIDVTSSYPDIYFRVFKQWFLAMPMQTSVVFVAAVIAFIFSFKSNTEKDISFNRLLGITLALFMITATMSTFYVDSRYTFYLYPFILSICAVVIVRVIPKSFAGNLKNISLIILVGLFFIVSDDFTIKDTMEIDSERVNFRLDYDGPRTRHYYPRIDFQSAAEYINTNRGSGSVLITSVPVIDYYLHSEERSYFYLPLTHDEFAGQSACGGKREIWSGLRLLYTEEAFKELIANSNYERWIVIYGPGKKIALPPIYKKIDDEFSDYHEFDSIEDAIHIYKIPAGAQVEL